MRQEEGQGRGRYIREESGGSLRIRKEGQVVRVLGGRGRERKGAGGRELGDRTNWRETSGGGGGGGGGRKGQEGGRAREEESLEGICNALVDKRVILPFSMHHVSGPC